MDTTLGRGFGWDFGGPFQQHQMVGFLVQKKGSFLVHSVVFLVSTGGLFDTQRWVFWYKVGGFLVGTRLQGIGPLWRIMWLSDVEWLTSTTIGLEHQ